MLLWLAKPFEYADWRFSWECREEIRADMQVVDVYYRDGNKLSENWVLIDLPYWLKQQGLDVFERTQKIMNPAL